MSENIAQNYLKKLDELEKKLLKAAAPSGEIMDEKHNIENYRDALRNFGSYDPAMRDLIINDLERDISRITMLCRLYASSNRDRSFKN